MGMVRYGLTQVDVGMVGLPLDEVMVQQRTV